MVNVEDIVRGLPPVTRTYLLLAMVLMGLCSLDLVSPFNLYLNWYLILRRGQIWRLLTCFLFFGDFGLHFFWNLYMLMFYCGNLEEDTFKDRPADFLWMLFITGSVVLWLSYIFGLGIFFGGAMLNVVTYIWSRKNPHTRMGVLFFSVQAPYLPWVLCGLSLLIGWGLADHLFGIAAGHVYYFFEEVYPLMPTSKGIRLMATPTLLRWAMKQREV